MVTSMEAIGYSELQKLGVPLEEEELERMRTASLDLDIKISDDVVENTIEDAELGGTYWIIHAIISNVSVRRIRLDRCRVDPPWSDPEFRLLEAARQNAQREYGYLPPAPSHPFARKDVLNHRFGPKGWLNPGNSMDGFILGVGSESIPFRYQDHQVAEVELAFWDGRGKLYLKKTRVTLIRSARLMRLLQECKHASSRNHHKRIPSFDKAVA